MGCRDKTSPSALGKSHFLRDYHCLESDEICLIQMEIFGFPNVCERKCNVFVPAA